MAELALVKNAADEDQVSGAKQKEWSADEQDKNDLVFLLSQPCGKRFFMRLFRMCGLYQTSYAKNPHECYFNEGHRDVALAVERDGAGVIETEILSAEAQGDEFLLMGLRLREGIDPQRYVALTGKALDGEKLQMLLDEGLNAGHFIFCPEKKNTATFRDGRCTYP